MKRISKNWKSLIIWTIYRDRQGGWQPFNDFLRNFYSQSRNNNKLSYITRDFNLNALYVTREFDLNLLDYNTNDKVKKFINTTFEYGLSLISKPTRVTRNSDTIRDHIITNFLIYSNVEIGIVFFSMTKMPAKSKSSVKAKIR